MIGRIAGVILHRARDQVLIDVHGVGYIVHVSERTAASLPPAGQPVALYTELQVREDLLQLFGFQTLLDKEWHRLLIGVQGVGAKASLSILGTLGAEGLARAIAMGDWSSVRKAQGVGPKLAQRVVLELKEKAPAIMALGGDLTVDAGGAIGAGIEPAPAAALPSTSAEVKEHAATDVPGTARVAADALSALTNLGYAYSEAAAAVAETQANAPEADMATLIRTSLRSLAPKG